MPDIPEQSFEDININDIHIKWRVECLIIPRTMIMQVQSTLSKLRDVINDKDEEIRILKQALKDSTKK